MFGSLYWHYWEHLLPIWLWFGLFSLWDVQWPIPAARLFRSWTTGEDIDFAWPVPHHDREPIESIDMALATNIYSRGSPHLWTNLCKFPEALDLDLDLKSILDVFIYRCWGSRSLRTSGSDPVTECPGARVGVRWSARMSFCKPGKFSVGNSTLNIITWNYSLDTECVVFFLPSGKLT